MNFPMNYFKNTQHTTYAAGRDAGSALPTRSEISNTDQWRTQDIFSSDEEWQRAYRRLKNLLPKLDDYRGKLGESAERLLGCLRLRDEIDEWFGKLYLYAGLKSDEDTRQDKYQQLRDKAASLLVEVNEKNSFFQPEILSLPEERLWELVDSEADLHIYRHYLEDLLRLKPHVLPEAQERLLAMSGEVSQGPYNIFSMFNNADIKFPTILDENQREVEVTKGRFSKLMRSHDRRVRKDAYDALYGTYQNWTNTLAATLSTNIKKNIFYARARNYASALEAALHADNIPVSVYENVVATINRNLAPLQRYMEFRKKVLELEDLRPWDLSVPLIRGVKFDIPYSESRKTIERALQPLGDAYLSILRKAFKQGWIDVFENVGKRSGAYSWSTHGVHPFILLNYNNTLDDMFTTAHELGHALHSHFTHNTQPVIYSGYTTFVAEVASTLNEALLIDHLLKTTGDLRRRFYLLNEYVDQIRGTVYTQTLFAEFEKKLHATVEGGEVLTASALSKMKRELYIRYFGPAFAMDSLYEINWCRIPHFYYNFYVYKYVTGFSAATAIARRIIAGDTAARDAYLHFLRRGNSDYSINLLMDAGVDMTSPAPIEATTRLMNDLIQEMEQIAEGPAVIK